MTTKDPHWLLKYDGHTTPHGVGILAWLSGDYNNDEVTLQFDKDGKMHTCIVNINDIVDEKDADAYVLDRYEEFLSVHQILTK